jgi:hypothetical protein
MVYSTQHHWISGLCPLFGILNEIKTQCFVNKISVLLQVKGMSNLLFRVR